MDPVIRRRRLLLIGAVVLASACAAEACGPRSPGALVGVSDRPSGGKTRDVADAGSRDAAAALPADYHASFKRVNKARFVSSGHASGRWEVDVWANEIAVKALASRSRDVPVGAILVEEHFEKSGTADPGPVMVMEKRPKGFAPDHGDWRWASIGSRGQLVRDGVIDACAGCHDDAPMDGLFPIVD